jgi:hypothetical protein
MNYVILKSVVRSHTRTRKGKLERVKSFSRKGEKKSGSDFESSINWKDIILDKLPVGYTWGGGKSYTIWLKDKELTGPSSKSPWAGNYVGITGGSRGKQIHITLQRSLQGKGLAPKLIKAALKEVGDVIMSSDEISNPHVYKVIDKLKKDREVRVTEEKSSKNNVVYKFHLK